MTQGVDSEYKGGVLPEGVPSVWLLLCSNTNAMSDRLSIRSAWTLNLER